MVARREGEWSKWESGNRDPVLLLAFNNCIKSNTSPCLLSFLRWRTRKHFFLQGLQSIKYLNYTIILGISNNTYFWCPTSLFLSLISSTAFFVGQFYLHQEVFHVSTILHPQIQEPAASFCKNTPDVGMLTSLGTALNQRGTNAPASYSSQLHFWEIS